MLNHEKWSGEIRKFYNFLMDPDACPTENE